MNSKDGTSHCGHFVTGSLIDVQNPENSEDGESVVVLEIKIENGLDESGESEIKPDAQVCTCVKSEEVPRDGISKNDVSVVSVKDEHDAGNSNLEEALECKKSGIAFRDPLLVCECTHSSLHVNTRLISESASKDGEILGGLTIGQCDIKDEILDTLETAEWGEGNIQPDVSLSKRQCEQVYEDLQTEHLTFEEITHDGGIPDEMEIDVPNEVRGEDEADAVEFTACDEEVKIEYEVPTQTVENPLAEKSAKISYREQTEIVYHSDVKDEDSDVESTESEVLKLLPEGPVIESIQCKSTLVADASRAENISRHEENSIGFEVKVENDGMSEASSGFAGWEESQMEAEDLSERCIHIEGDAPAEALESKNPSKDGEIIVEMEIDVQNYVKDEDNADAVKIVSEEVKIEDEVLMQITTNPFAEKFENLSYQEQTFDGIEIVYHSDMKGKDSDVESTVSEVLELQPEESVIERIQQFRTTVVAESASLSENISRSEENSIGSEVVVENDGLSDVSTESGWEESGVEDEDLTERLVEEDSQIIQDPAADKLENPSYHEKIFYGIEEVCRSNTKDKDSDVECTQSEVLESQPEEPVIESIQQFRTTVVAASASLSENISRNEENSIGSEVVVENDGLSDVSTESGWEKSGLEDEDVAERPVEEDAPAEALESERASKRGGIIDDYCIDDSEVALNPVKKVKVAETPQSAFVQTLRESTPAQHWLVQLQNQIVEFGQMSSFGVEQTSTLILHSLLDWVCAMPRPVTLYMYQVRLKIAQEARELQLFGFAPNDQLFINFKKLFPQGFFAGHPKSIDASSEVGDLVDKGTSRGEILRRLAVWYHKESTKSRLEPVQLERKYYEMRTDEVGAVHCYLSKDEMRQFVTQEGLYCILNGKVSRFPKVRDDLLGLLFETEFEVWYHHWPRSTDDLLLDFLGKRPHSRAPKSMFVIFLSIIREWLVEKGMYLSSVLPVGEKDGFARTIFGSELFPIFQTLNKSFIATLQKEIFYIQSFNLKFGMRHCYESYSLCPEHLMKNAKELAVSTGLSGVSFTKDWLQRFAELTVACSLSPIKDHDHPIDTDNYFPFDEGHFQRAFFNWQLHGSPRRARSGNANYGLECTWTNPLDHPYRSEFRDKVAKWYLEQVMDNVFVKPYELKEKSEEIAHLMGFFIFNASKSWMRGFLWTYGIRYYNEASGTIVCSIREPSGDPQFNKLFQAWFQEGCCAKCAKRVPSGEDDQEISHLPCRASQPYCPRELEAAISVWYSNHNFFIRPGDLERNSLSIAEKMKIRGFFPSKSWMETYIGTHGLYVIVKGDCELFLKPAFRLLRCIFFSEFEVWYNQWPLSVGQTALSNDCGSNFDVELCEQNLLKSYFRWPKTVRKTTNSINNVIVSIIHKQDRSLSREDVDVWVTGRCAQHIEAVGRIRSFDQAMSVWYLKNKERYITPNEVRMKAGEFARKMRLPMFKAKEAWLVRFVERHGIFRVAEEVPEFLSPEGIFQAGGVMKLFAAWCMYKPTSGPRNGVATRGPEVILEFPPVNPNSSPAENVDASRSPPQDPQMSALAGKINLWFQDASKSVRVSPAMYLEKVQDICNDLGPDNFPRLTHDRKNFLKELVGHHGIQLGNSLERSSKYANAKCGILKWIFDLAYELWYYSFPFLLEDLFCSAAKWIPGSVALENFVSQLLGWFALLRESGEVSVEKIMSGEREIANKWDISESVLELISSFFYSESRVWIDKMSTFNLSLSLWCKRREDCVTSKDLIKQAESMSKESGLNEFIASEAWLRRFTELHELRFTYNHVKRDFPSCDEGPKLPNLGKELNDSTEHFEECMQADDDDGENAHEAVVERMTAAFEALVSQWYRQAGHSRAVCPGRYLEKVMEIRKKSSLPVYDGLTKGFEDRKSCIKSLVRFDGIQVGPRRRNRQSPVFIDAECGILKFRFELAFEIWYYTYPLSFDYIIGDDYPLAGDDRSIVNRYSSYLHNWHVQFRGTGGASVEEIVVRESEIAKSLTSRTNKHELIAEWCLEWERRSVDWIDKINLFDKELSSWYAARIRYVTAKQLKMQAVITASNMGMERFSPSDPWLTRFVQLHGLWFGGFRVWPGYGSGPTTTAPRFFTKYFQKWRESDAKAVFPNLLVADEVLGSSSDDDDSISLPNCSVGYVNDSFDSARIELPPDHDVILQNVVTERNGGEVYTAADSTVVIPKNAKRLVAGSPPDQSVFSPADNQVDMNESFDSVQLPINHDVIFQIAITEPIDAEAYTAAVNIAEIVKNAMGFVAGSVPGHSVFLPTDSSDDMNDSLDSVLPPDHDVIPENVITEGVDEVDTPMDSIDELPENAKDQPVAGSPAEQSVSFPTDSDVDIIDSVQVPLPPDYEVIFQNAVAEWFRSASTKGLVTPGFYLVKVMEIRRQTGLNVYDDLTRGFDVRKNCMKALTSIHGVQLDRVELKNYRFRGFLDAQSSILKYRFELAFEIWYYAYPLHPNDVTIDEIPMDETDLSLVNKYVLCLQDWYSGERRCGRSMSSQEILDAGKRIACRLSRSKEKHDLIWKWCHKWSVESSVLRNNIVQLDERVVSWYRARELSMKPADLRKQAEHTAQNMGIRGFTATEKWLRRFVQLHGFNFTFGGVRRAFLGLEGASQPDLLGFQANFEEWLNTDYMVEDIENQ